MSGWQSSGRTSPLLLRNSSTKTCESPRYVSGIVSSDRPFQPPWLRRVVVSATIPCDCCMWVSAEINVGLHP